jgi:hypothetical protein
MIRGEGTNSAKHRSPSNIKEKRGNLGEARGTVKKRKDKKKRCRVTEGQKTIKTNWAMHES